MTAIIDPFSIVGKNAPNEEHVQVAIIGAGPAGLAAAIQLASKGLSVKLIDENPIDGALAGTDVPLYFGGRMTAALNNPDRMLSQIFATEPALETAFEAGVDVALGTSCWGLFLPNDASRELNGPTLGLTDGKRAWTLGFERLIIATGSRDLGLFFEGSDQPGVMGVGGFDVLVRRYDVFSGQKIVIFGSDDIALSAAELALSKGISIAGIIEVEAAPTGNAQLAAALADSGVPFYCGYTVKCAGRGLEGIADVSIIPVSGGPGATLECDTLVMAIGKVPVIELFDAAGVAVEANATAGGFIPKSPDGAKTTSEFVFAAGDCAGIMSIDRAMAEASGRYAANCVLASLGLDVDVSVSSSVNQTGRDHFAYRIKVMQALIAAGGDEVLVCQCEEVRRSDLLGVCAPRYLGAATEKSKCRNLATIAEDGPLNHDQMKRLTRVTMGECQGRRCREQVAMMLSIAGGTEFGKVPLAGYRAPVRPLPLAVLATLAETSDMTANWPVWFGIPTQWIPYFAIGTEREEQLLEDVIHM